MPVLSSDLEAAPGEQDGLVEGRRAMHSRATMEVDALNVHSQFLYFLHALVDLFWRIQVITKLVGEWCGQLVRSFLFDCNSPQNTHAGCQFVDLDELVDGVCSGHLDAVALGPDEIALILDGVRVDHIAFIGADAQYVLQLSAGGAIVACLFCLQVVEQGQSWVGLDGVVSLDPGEFLRPVVELAHDLIGVVEKAAGLQTVAGDDGVDLPRLLIRQQARIVALQEVERVGESVLVNQQVALGKATTRDHFKQCEKLVIIACIIISFVLNRQADHF